MGVSGRVTRPDLIIEEAGPISTEVFEAISEARRRSGQSGVDENTDQD